MLLGSITGNEPEGYSRFAKWLGRKPELALLAFNQMGVQPLTDCVPWIVNQAKQFMALGARILWSVPAPGKGQLEAIVAGVHDGLYRLIARQIIAASPSDNRYRVRLLWEQNLDWQENAAKDKNGRWDAALYVAAWERLAGIFRTEMGPKCFLIACPNVRTEGYDPAELLPRASLYDCLAQDFYLQKAYNKPGAFEHFRTHPRGLQWAADLSKQQGKLYGLSELGMDDDRFEADARATFDWFRGLGDPWAHHLCWWDRPEVIDSRLAVVPSIATTFKVKLA